MDTSLSPMLWHTHDQPSNCKQAQRIILKSYISFIEFKDFHFMAQRANSEGWDCNESKTGHDAMIIVSNELVQLLQILTKK
jgi:hypothetical protein